MEQIKELISIMRRCLEELDSLLREKYYNLSFSLRLHGYNEVEVVLEICEQPLTLVTARGVGAEELTSLLKEKTLDLLEICAREVSATMHFIVSRIEEARKRLEQEKAVAR